MNARCAGGRCDFCADGSPALERKERSLVQAALLSRAGVYRVCSQLRGRKRLFYFLRIKKFQRIK